MAEILQKRLWYSVQPDVSLPGILPLPEGEWLFLDDAYGAQMAERARLIAQVPGDVLYLDPEARAAARELWEVAGAELVARHGYRAEGAGYRRPDGLHVALDVSEPMRALGQLCQDDFCILQKRGAEHVLTGAALCFPASWRLAEKAGRPLVAIHDPVDSYDDKIAARVQRLFDGVQVGRSLWRFNALWYEDPTLHQPRSEIEPRPLTGIRAPYFRTERQVILRLPQTQAVIFSIHTSVLRAADL